MDLLDFAGQTLDGKYQMTRELGRGGMGTVYLANHLGTERPVAIKIISPQYMQRTEFVERFRREARAAGRLRHPNVVNVTDFGFAETHGGQVAYLVMEYLDGCTLGEILDEERNLPVAWTLDILEQVCSAVQEAHEQGIIHRDLKPDNIWLEPNQRGGYTVKVLDFGIAKLEDHIEGGQGEGDQRYQPLPTYAATARTTFAGLTDGGTLAGDGSSTLISKAVTLSGTEVQDDVSDGATVRLEPLSDEGKTAILTDLNREDTEQDAVKTKVITDLPDTDQSASQSHTSSKSLLDTPSASGLTRVGAVLGTPLYMSPEQCRGEHLDPRSDIYSLGVIAYQMLSGETPFSGDFKHVMESHKSEMPPPLKARRVRRKMRHAIHAALDKDPEKRPQTAEAFASVLRSRSEGIFGLLRRSLVIYSEHLPKFLLLTTFFTLPLIVLTLAAVIISFLRISEVVPASTARLLIGTFSLLSGAMSMFCTFLVIGTITWIVTQYLAVPLRPVRLRPALVEARKKWRTFAGTGMISTILTFVIGGITCGIGFVILNVLWTLVAPVVMMEHLKGRAALKRSKDLVKRSVMTAAAAVLIIFLIPAIVAGTISFVVNVTDQAIEYKTGQPPAVEQTQPSAAPEPGKPAANDDGFNIKFNGNRALTLAPEEADMQKRVKHTILESLIQILWLPMHILVLSFSSIIVALLYLKTRLAGGETMNDLLERFEDDDRPRKKWQERVRARLIQSGRIPSRS